MSKLQSSIASHRFGGSNQQVSVIGQGTWMLEDSAPTAVAALQRGIDLGLTHIDTAEMYGSGAAERLVGMAIKGRRQQVFLVSKVLPGNASRRNTLQACEDSLQRLGTDYLDCYLLHWRGRIKLTETLGAFESLQQQGKIRGYGVSNFDVDDLDEVLSIVGPGKLACNQVLYHVQERAIEHEVIPWCQRNDVAVVAYSPLGHGNFPARSGKGGSVLEQLAAKYAVTSYQIALAFVCRLPELFAIPKSLNPAHVAANAAAAALQLAAEDIAAIDQAFPRGVKPRSLPTI